MVRKIYILFAFLVSINASAQLTSTNANTPPYTPENLISNVFLGSGVQINNIEFQGSKQAVGYFSGGQPIINLERGIVLSTGNANNVSKNNLSTEEDGEFTSGYQLFDVDLQAISSEILADYVIYTIKFIPTSDTLRFRYVFGSEEYPEYVCREFNDVFGFFISGPDPKGGLYNSENIALVPDPSDLSGLTFTDVPVAINNVHSGENDCSEGFSTYYNENPVGFQNLSINAFLDVFTAQAIVVPCEEYTIKLALADANDQLFNSVVFLEAKSFGTDALTVSSNTFSIDNTLAEGCEPAELVFELASNATSDRIISYNLLNYPNSATEGVDFSPLPENLIIPAGSDELVVTIDVFSDGITETDEVIAIEIQVDVCTKDTLEFILKDNVLSAPVLPSDTLICPDQEWIINPGLPPIIQFPTPYAYTKYENLPISPEGAVFFSEIFVFGVMPEIFFGEMIESVCIIGLEHRLLDELDIYLISPGGNVLELSTDNGNKPLNITDIDRMENTCFTLDATENINRGNSQFGPIDPDNETYTGNYLPEGDWTDLSDGSSPVNGTWQLMIIDDTPGGITGFLEGWSINFKLPYAISYSWASDDPEFNCFYCEDITVSPNTNATYTITAIDSYGCETQSSVSARVNDVPQIEILSSNPISCFNAMDGSASFLASGASFPFEYSIGNTTNMDGNFEMLGFADSLLIVTDNLGCETSFFFSVGRPEGFEFSVNLSQPEPCISFNTFNVEVSVEGGEGSLSYIWDNGIETPQLTGVAAGTYQLTVTDETGCSDNFTVEVPDYEVLEYTPVVIPPVCKGNNGSVTININSGVGPFIVSWEDDIIASVRDDLLPGIYSVSVKDGFGCEITETILIPEADTIIIDLIRSNVSCPGLQDGAATAMVSGGKGPYDYFWSGNAISDSFIQNLNIGSYELIVVDVNGCTASTAFDIETEMPPSFTIEKTNVTCSGNNQGSILIDTIGSGNNISILWEDGFTGFLRNQLSEGTYCFSIGISENCSIDTCVIISSPLPLISEDEIEEPGCAGENNGSISLEVSGGNPPYNYQWSGPNVDGKTSKNIDSLIAGTYFVTISDINNCQLAKVFTLSSNSEIMLDTVRTSVSCFGANDAFISAIASGGTAPFIYQWSGPDNYTSGDSIILNLGVGGYTLELTDAKGCVNNYFFDIQGPQFPLASSQTPEDLVCSGNNNGSLSISPEGGTPPYSILWDNGEQGSTLFNLSPGIYSFTITDSRGCTFEDLGNVKELDDIGVQIEATAPSCIGTNDGRAKLNSVFYGSQIADPEDFTFTWSISPPTNGLEVFGLTGGETYQLLVTDNNGCVAVHEFIVPLPEPVSAEIVDKSEIKCFGDRNGKLTIKGVGGTGNYSFAWNAPIANQSGETIENLQSGTYEVTISDENNCTGIQSFTLDEPQPLVLSLRGKNVDCNGGNSGSIFTGISGGTEPYQYLWSNGATERDIQNLEAGQYFLSVSDGNGCSVIDSIIISEPASPILIDVAVSDATCAGSQDGKIDVDAMGGSGFFEYSLDDLVYESGNTFGGLKSGVYAVYVRDFNGCKEVYQNIVVKEPNEVILDLGPDQVVFIGESITLNPSVFNAVGNINYVWISNNLNLLSCNNCENPVFNAEREASFELIIFDERGCEARDFISFRIENFAPFDVPTAFTPNGDGENDRLIAFGLRIKKVISFKVYDKWGSLLYNQELFDINDLNSGWDGTFKGELMPSGLYYWAAEVEYESGNFEIFQGNTTLIR